MTWYFSIPILLQFSSVCALTYEERCSKLIRTEKTIPNVMKRIELNYIGQFRSIRDQCRIDGRDRVRRKIEDVYEIGALAIGDYITTDRLFEMKAKYRGVRDFCVASHQQADKALDRYSRYMKTTTVEVGL